MTDGLDPVVIADMIQERKAINANLNVGSVAAGCIEIIAKER